MNDFLKTAVRNYTTVGAVAEISRYVTARVLCEVPPGARTVVELGAGNGTLTKELVKRLPRDGRLIAVEILPGFVKELQTIKDSRLSVIEGDAAEVLARLRSDGTPLADVIVSNIPFSLMKVLRRRTILSRAADMLAPDGSLIVYQNLPVVATQLKELFHEIAWGLELRNFPPYFVITARGKRQVTRMSVAVSS